MTAGTWRPGEDSFGGSVRLRNHAPALALMLIIGAVVWLGWPWPDPVADGFDVQGRPVHWTWPPTVVFPAAILLLVSAGVDGGWQAMERGRKRFNPLSLFDEAMIAWMLVHLAGRGEANGMPPAVRVWAWAAGAIALAAAFLLERYRPAAVPAPTRKPQNVQDMASFVSDLSAAQAAHQRWSYWSVQRPPHQVLFGILGASFVIGGIAIPGGPFVMRLLLLVAGMVVLAVCRGGLRTVVTPSRLVLRAGRLGPSLLRLPMSEIAEVAVPEFDPMRDFGGWGIKRGPWGQFGGVWAFNLASSGVLVRTSNGKRYLIGTDEPERLAAALSIARTGAA